MGTLVFANCGFVGVFAGSPFVRPQKVVVNQAPSQDKIRLDQLEFTGFFTMGGETTFGLFDKRNNVNLWLPQKKVEEGFSVESFKSDSGELRIRFGGESRLITLNENAITPIKIVKAQPSAKTAKKIVKKDPETLQKEEDARMLVTDLMQIGMEEREKYRKERAKRLEEIRARQAAQVRAKQNQK